jgi:hypothetical protein
VRGHAHTSYGDSVCLRYAHDELRNSLARAAHQVKLVPLPPVGKRANSGLPASWCRPERALRMACQPMPQRLDAEDEFALCLSCDAASPYVWTRGISSRRLHREPRSVLAHIHFSGRPDVEGRAASHS